MAYDESVFRRRPEDQTGVEAPTYRTNGFSAADYRGRRREAGDADTGGRHGEQSADLLRRTAGEPDEAPATYDNGRDRLGIHIGWEIVLLLGVAAVAYLLYRLDPASLRRPALDALLISATVLGLLTLGAGLTLRAGVPNLAVGPIAVAAALQYAENGDRGLVEAALPALVTAALGGLLVGLVVIAFHVPGWAATLAGALGVVVFIQFRLAPVNVQGAYDPSDHAFFLFGAFASAAVVGGALGTIPKVRRMTGRFRPVGDPARRRGLGVSVPVIGALVVSSMLAVVAGVLFAAQSTLPISPTTGMEWTGLAVGLALLAGTSAYGRRGGIFGTLLAVVGMAVFLDYAERRNLDIALFAVAACTLGAGLVITRLVETYGRPLPVAGPVEEVWQTDAPAPAAFSPEAPEPWSPAVPAQGRSDRWDDRWGQENR